MTWALRGARAAMRAVLAPSSPAVRLGRPRRSDRGDALDPQLQAMLRLHALLPPPRADALQRRRSARWSALAVAPSVPPGVRTTPLTLAGLPARRFDPGGLDPAGAPALLFLHGGGFTVGDLDTHHGICAVLAARAGCVVVSVGYRLAPEHRFPAAVEDAAAAWRALHAQAPALGLDRDRLVMGGDSAGGNLTAVAVRLLRGEPSPLGQLLIYPGVDMTLSQPSHRTLGAGFYLDAPMIRWFLDQYLQGPGDALDPRASPLLAEDLSGLPRAHVVTAGFDPLRDEAELYARRLTEAGVPVALQAEPSLIHGFASMAGISAQAHAALLRIGDGLTALIAR